MDYYYGLNLIEKVADITKRLGGSFMGISNISNDPNVVLDIVAEALKKQQELVQKVTRMNLELSLKEEKMRVANDVLVDFYA